MEVSKRAVGSYRRSRMIDVATSEEDNKATPVYKLEEICEILRTSPVGIVKEMSELVIKRLHHNNPIVKHKVLRLIKFSVGRSGAEFRREMQRRSVAVKQLLHYKGRPHPLKGDALNKAVRETAQGALSEIFSTAENKSTSSEVKHKRMEGFGNTDSMRLSDEKPCRTQSVKKDDDEGYSSHIEATNGSSDPTYTESKTREERLLETIVTPGGVRLKPPRDALRTFLLDASKMDALALSRALESRLLSPHWQVRTKAICVLEAILQKKDDEYFAVVASYFRDNIHILIKCSESPQASVRDKANRVLNLLGEKQIWNTSENARKPETTVTEMPNLIDAGDSDLLRTEDCKSTQDNLYNTSSTSLASPSIDDLFCDNTTFLSTSTQMTDDDPFADVSFHNTQVENEEGDLFAGMTVGENSHSTFGIDPFDIFTSYQPLQEQEEHESDVMILLSSLSICENDPGTQLLYNSLSGVLGTGIASNNMNAMYPNVEDLYSAGPGVLFNQLSPEPVEFGTSGGLLTKQQSVATETDFQSLDDFRYQKMSSDNVVEILGTNSTPLPHIFNTHLPTQDTLVTENASIMEETKAFDFILDHLAAARDPKRVI